jgi:hypothetical protein
LGVADDLADLLVTGNLSATVHIGELLAEPSKAAVITPTPGLPNLRTYGGSVLERVSVQVRCRASDYPTADNLMASAHGKLSGVKDKILSGRTYHWIVEVQQPFYLGLDENERPIFACNFDILRSATT